MCVCGGSGLCSPEMELDLEGHYIVFMFRRRMQGVSTDYLIQAITGDEFLHVDIIFVPGLSPSAASAVERARSSSGGEESQKIEEIAGVAERRQRMQELFTIFVRDKFKGYVDLNWHTRGEDMHALLAYRVEELEYDRAREYISKLRVNNVRYNYSDLVLCAMPKSMAAIVPMSGDVPPHTIPHTIFCSQAAVLMLRECLGGSGCVVERVLQGVNSRFCRPQDLYTLLSEGGLFVRLRVFEYVHEGRMVQEGVE